MAVLSTYEQIGNREDLIDVVTNIDPEETPILSTLSKVKATGKLHEFMTETLDAPGENAVLEGADATYGTLTPRVRLNNYCQIARKTGQVSDTQEAVLKAGVKSEMAHQKMKASKELARDMERILIQSPQAMGTASVARRSGGIYSWISSNRNAMEAAPITGTCTGNGTKTVINVAAGHSAAANDQILLTGGTGAGQYRTIVSVSTNALTVASLDGPTIATDNSTTYIVYTVPAAISQAKLDAMLQSAWDNGGKVDCIFTGGFNKLGISGFATKRSTASEKTLVNTVDVYESPFGSLPIKLDRWVPNGSVLGLDTQYWRTAFLRPIKSEELARTGSSRKFMMEAEFTLEALAEKSSAHLSGTTLS